LTDDLMRIIGERPMKFKVEREEIGIVQYGFREVIASSLIPLLDNHKKRVFFSPFYPILSFLTNQTF